ncbi:MAG: polysaccharide biosynthesis C-terminal domain-containing protein [Oscillospiraceae bacterium]|nr:polysaccharide biosynthesis C-terminal domain-containing protein [Oscillospiraceae bacterium]
MRRKLPIFYSALLLTAVNLLLRLVGTSFQVYLSSRIGAEGIGLLQLVMSVGAMALVAGMAGIRTATMYLTAEQIGRKKPQNITWVLSGCLMYSIICSAAVGSIVYIFAPRIAENWIGNIHTLSSLRLFAAFLPVNCLTGVMVGYFTGASRIGTLAAVEVAEQLCCMFCTVLLLSFWAGHDAARSCQAVVMGSAIGACFTLLSLVILRILERPKTSDRLPVGRQLAYTAIPLALADDLRTGISTVENLMVPKRLALYGGSLSPLAAFGTVCGMVFPVLTFPMAILFGLTELLIPELARCRAAGSTIRIHYLVKQSLRIALFFGTLCGGILFLSADELCMALYKSKEAGTYLRWFSLLAVMLYSDGVTDAMIKGLGQQKASVRYNILTNTMDVAFLYILLPKYGITGYFASFLITHIINFCLSLRRLLRITVQKIPLHIPILTLAAAALALWLCHFVTGAVLRSAAYTAILLCLLFLLRIISKDDVRWMKSLICRK